MLLLKLDQYRRLFLLVEINHGNTKSDEHDSSGQHSEPSQKESLVQYKLIEHAFLILFMSDYDRLKMRFFLRDCLELRRCGGISRLIADCLDMTKLCAELKIHL